MDAVGRGMSEEDVVRVLVGAICAHGRATNDQERASSMGTVRMMLAKYVQTSVAAGMDAVMHAHETGCALRWADDARPGRTHTCHSEAGHAGPCKCRCRDERAVLVKI